MAMPTTTIGHTDDDEPSSPLGQAYAASWPTRPDGQPMSEHEILVAAREDGDDASESDERDLPVSRAARRNRGGRRQGRRGDGAGLAHGRDMHCVHCRNGGLPGARGCMGQAMQEEPSIADIISQHQGMLQMFGSAAPDDDHRAARFSIYGGAVAFGSLALVSVQSNGTSSAIVSRSPYASCSLARRAARAATTHESVSAGVTTVASRVPQSRGRRAAAMCSSIWSMATLPTTFHRPQPRQPQAQAHRDRPVAAPPLSAPLGDVGAVLVIRNFGHCVLAHRVWHRAHWQSNIWRLILQLS